MFQKYFPKIVCLSLATRSNRRKQFDAQAQKLGMEFDHVTATPKEEFRQDQVRPLRGSGHHLGTYAHNHDLAQLLQFCIEKSVASLLFFEDDCLLEDNAFDLFEQAYHNEMPSQWDLFYLGAWHRTTPEQTGNFTCRVTKAHLSHAVAIHQQVMPFLLQQCQKNEQLFDQILAEKIQPLGHSYCLHPSIAKQSDGFSDLWGMPIQQSTRTG